MKKANMLIVSSLLWAPRLFAAEIDVRVQGDTLYYTGQLEAAAVNRAGALLKASDGGIRRLVIDSPGGDVNVGMDLAELILAARLDVQVDRLCASSCANYVFTAGQRKKITGAGVVIWHGSAIQEGVEAGPTVDDIESPVELSLEQKQALLEEYREQAIGYVEEARVRQGRFYERLGVDARVTVAGQQLNAAPEWTLSVKDMARFGIRNVEAPLDYGRHLSNGYVLLDLDDYPDYMAVQRD